MGHDCDAVGQAQHLRQLGGDDDDRLALPGELLDEVVDLFFGPDVDAAGGLVEDQDIAVAHEPLRDDDLLLVAAGQLTEQLMDVGGLDAQLLAVLLADSADLAVEDETTDVEVAHRGHRCSP